MTTQSDTKAAHDPLADAVRNPANPAHLMVLKPIANRVRVYVGALKLADTTQALRVVEIGKSLYDPLVYVPITDLTRALEDGEKTTHCPLKGDATYKYLGDQEIGWQYKTLSFANRLENHIGFWSGKVRMVEGE